MTTQSEQKLENTLMKQLEGLGFSRVAIRNEDDLEANLKVQLEKFNKTTFSETEFERILNYLSKGNSFEKAKALRDRFVLVRDEGSELENISIQFFNTTEWCKNEYQITNQIIQIGKYENRYDVTLLINGLPLVQIELKRRGIEMKEAFNQIKRYHKHSFAGSLFDFIQIFVISNGVNTKYFSNNPKQGYEQTFYWTGEKNNKITKLEDFAEEFLEKCKVSQMIAEYIVLAEALKIPMILRPYQYYAVKAIEKRVVESNKNGYIWHTTGSGKTLTSFKVAQILSRKPDIKKILFVVDRKDLDIQTTKEFNSFSDGSVDGTNRTGNLVEQLRDPNRKMIVTTIQKLDIAIKKENYLKQFENLADEKVVIIFDECHRSQFGQTHTAIKKFFTKAQLFGFTGTPIFAENNVGGTTTKDVFDKCLHKYIITNAISDNNVLGFSVEYVGRYRKKGDDVLEADFEVEQEVEGIDTKEILESRDRLEKITKWILSDWKTKTKSGKFNAIFATASVDVLKKYYTLFKSNKPKNFKIATIFTYKANEEESTDMLEEDVFADNDDKINEHSRDFLESCIKDYNADFGTNYSTDNFYAYHKDVQEKVKTKQVDLVVVVNMMLTGFDSKYLNTLYVDKNLRYHGLIQAYSRTNRLFGPEKPHGNIVSFRNLKKNTDKALLLFGDENAKEIVFKQPYEKQKEEFNAKLEELKNITPDISAVDKLESEEDKAVFIKAFRDLLRIKSSLETFAEFSFSDLDMDEQEFSDYMSKYLDLYEERKNSGDRDLASVIDEIDFELELIGRDRVNYDYIIKLIIGLKNISSEKIRQRKTNDILKIMDRDISLRKKKDLIEKFIEDNLPKIPNSDDVEKEFEIFWDKEKRASMNKIIEDENIDADKFEKIIGEYLYTDRLPLREELIDLKKDKPKLIERSRVVDSIKKMIVDFVERFEW